MKNLTLLILSIFILSFQTDKTVKVIDKGIYKVWYSEDLRNPTKCVYSVYHYKDNPEVNRKSMDFYPEPGIKTASTKDYEFNNYDKGHLAPAETFSDTKEHLKLTFSYANCAVQHFQLNRGLWNKLENKEREWSQKDSLVITVGVIFDKPVKKLPTGTAIPKEFTKVIKFVKSKTTKKYRFPNAECKEKLEFYEVK